MANNSPHGSSGAVHLAYNSRLNVALPGRRSSYASVAAGENPSYDQSLTSTSRPGTFSHLATSNLPSPLNPLDQQRIQSSRAPHRASASDALMDDGINVPDSWARGGSAGYSSQHGYGQGLGTFGSGGSSNGDGFFIPSYLQTSTYIERLQIAHEAKVAAQREAAPAQAKGNGTLSSRSSSISLPKLAPSHRGMTYEVIEHQPPEDTGGLIPLPSKWAEADKNQAMEIGMDGLDVRFVGQAKLHDHEAAAVRTDHPMPIQGGLYYYEVTIACKGKEGLLGIGFSGPKIPLEKMPGWEPDSWGWHGDDGNTFCCQNPGKKYGPTYTTGDVTPKTHELTIIGTAFRDLKDVSVYPSVGMRRPQAQMIANFGQRPFVFDIDDMMRRERDAIREEINATSITSLHSYPDESFFLKELVSQFLTHDGFVETAKAFAKEVRTESRPLQFDTPVSNNELPIEEDLDASYRQQIRSAIMDGDIDKALKRTNAYYPRVTKDHSHVYFRLRCQKLVEMIRQTAELLEVSPAKPAKPLNGHQEETDMDVDEPKPELEDWDKMETEEADTAVKYQELLEDTLRYGQELKQEFQGDPNTEGTFKEIFSLFMYEDPRKSPQAHLLDRASRVPVAEELNSAILVSLGKSSSAAIEILYQQTEALVDYISESGGAGAFINVRNDFLR
ncbi:MAG: hypothetical protein Q9170_005519 [Blastenia crenularia]